MDASKEQKRVIYVADDDEDILDVISMVLVNLGFSVKTTLTGDFQDKDQADLYLLDINLSGKNGGEICKTLKSKQVTKHIPVIMISANDDIKEVAEDCGADGFLPKPFEIKALEELVKTQLRMVG